jgi:hypothetical protein
MNKEKEIDLIITVIGHPAGFDVDLFGGMICIRSHCDGYEVAWEEAQAVGGIFGKRLKKLYKDFTDLKEAAAFFVDKRYELELGLDIEAELFKQLADLK